MNILAKAGTQAPIVALKIDAFISEGALGGMKILATHREVYAMFAEPVSHQRFLKTGRIVLCSAGLAACGVVLVSSPCPRPIPSPSAIL